METANREAYIDEIIATTVGVEPEAMFYVMERMNLKMNAMIDNTIERDPALAAFVDEVIAGIDAAFDQLISKKGVIKDSESQNAFATFENNLDLWIDSQPDLKFVKEQERKNKKHVA